MDSTARPRNLLLPLAGIAAGLLAACATMPPGEDKTGQEMKRQSAPVLAALAQYHDDYDRYPETLYLLVPKYLHEIPFDPNLTLDTLQATLSLYYKVPWPQTGAVMCVTPLKAQAWACHGAP